MGGTGGAGVFTHPYIAIEYPSCTLRHAIHDNIPANIFEPQILMTIGGIQKRLKRLLAVDFA